MSVSLLSQKPDDVIPDYEMANRLISKLLGDYDFTAIEKFKLYLFLEDIYTGDCDRIEDDKEIRFTHFGYSPLTLSKEEFRISRVRPYHIEGNICHAVRHDDVFKDLEDMRNKMGSNFTDAYIYLKDYHLKNKSIPDDFEIFPKDHGLGLVKLPNISGLAESLMLEIITRGGKTIDPEYIKDYPRIPNDLYYLDLNGNTWDI